MKNIVVTCAALLIVHLTHAQITPAAADSANVIRPDTIVRSQPKDQRPVVKRISLGGSTGFWIQPSRTHLEITALLAYRFPKILTLGPGYRYIYTRNRIYGKNLNSYGPNFFARAQLTRRIYLWSEWEHLRTEYAVQLANSSVETQSDELNSFFLGAGYVRQLGRKGRGGISIQVLYNFLYNREENSPYYSPVIYRIGYFF
ncbi:hypothetical protein WBG78_19000 [Chryseolinea sp. T2]|uniref:hypothetical protein n=1 Tax=Chryseolinea sp. T2 TaxID=3129255 RepID=UPI0030771121